MICKILIRVRHEFEGSKDIWMWTGYTWEELIQQAAEELKYQTIPTTVTIIRNINVLVDGPYIESKRDISLPYMGSSNQRVIGCNKSFALRRPVLWWTPEDKKGK
nr:MAG TPA: 4Fe-4S single cluster domain protein [Caudoviricetes sp.]DAX49372.1 MAG TPA: 4Fe-4S single cluster domain protein [Caudoviricetes sp.]